MRISGHTRIVGVIGDPISHTRSPAMHNAAFAHCNLDWAYVPFHVRPKDLSAAFEGFRAVGVRGVNATIPHKEALLSLVDDASDEASFIGAVNTVVFEPDGLTVGYNTDAEGFLRALREAEIPSPVGQRVVVFGAGGAARAVVAALAQAKAGETRIVNRTVEKAERLASDAEKMGVRATAAPLTEQAIKEAVVGSALLVNATSAGMHHIPPLPIDAALLRPPLSVYDIVYAPPETPLLADAKANGCRTLNGLGMLVHQGAIAFERWTGATAPVDVMRDALLAPL